MKALEYPFDSDYILKKKKSIKKELLENENNFLEKKIAILGGSTTSDIKLILELFLLNHGIKPTFYESEYNQYWQDAMFSESALKAFEPDIIFIHTSNCNIVHYPNITDTKEEVEHSLEQEYQHFEVMWEKLFGQYHCPIIQNNFEYLSYRILGNQDSVILQGKTSFINQLNMKFSEYAMSHESFYINDINYQSAYYGLEKWFDPFYYHMYKYSVAPNAIPYLAFNVANIIKAIYGKNKKGLVLDLDNTLWGGVVGDDGVCNLKLGPDTSEGQVYSAFQSYLKELKNIGIILNIDSKNDYDNAISGLNHPDSTLKPEDFIVIKANWEPKSKNMLEIAEEVNLGVDSLVFIDDNPAERAIINQHLPSVQTPSMDRVENYIRLIDQSGFFEVTNLSKDDLNKNEMYKENAERNKIRESFQDYGEYLKSLEMHATIDKFIPMYMARIAQLTNKSNQFNLTTKRYTQAEIEEVAEDSNYLTLYGKLEDIFGDNGVVSVVIGHKKEKILDIDLWIMSCRVLKRDLEFAMFDVLVEKCLEKNIQTIYGYYYKTAKNSMVKDFYLTQGFEKIEEDEEGNSKWKFEITPSYEKKNKYIKVEEKR